MNFATRVKQHTGLCLHNREKRVLGWTPPPPRGPLISGTSELGKLVQNSLQYGQMMLSQHYRTAFSAQTGTCLKRQPPTTTTQTYMSILKQWVPTSKSALMWLSPRTSPHMPTRSRGWQQRFVICKRPEMKHSDQEIKQPSKQQEPICPVASRMRNGHMHKKSIITSQAEPVASHSDHHWHQHSTQ